MERRIYDEAAERHFEENEQMLFLSGPRRVGKTTVSLHMKERRELYYFNWDDAEDRLILGQGPVAILDAVDIERARKEKPLLAFDEIHKSRRWKQFLKGFFDKYHYQVDVLVTGSARLDVYQRGGDSLMGRYFQYRVHPFSVAELIDPSLGDSPTRLPKPIDEDRWKALWKFGGFPEPFLRADERFANRWSLLRNKQLFNEDLRDLTRVHDIAQVELLAEWIRRQVGSQVSRSELAKRVGITSETVKRWIETLRSTFYLFSVHPWSNQIPRSLTKEPKYFLFDWSKIEDKGARAENFVASHLLKAVHFWTDHGYGEYGLYYLRDRQKREVDFLVVRDGKPWMMVEVKNQHRKGLSSALHHFAKCTGAPHVFQLAFDLPYEEIDCFSLKKPAIVSARTLLSQLPA